MGEMRALKSVGLRTLVYTIAVSAISVVISLVVVNLLQPGAGVDPALARSLMAEGAAGAQAIADRAGEATSGRDAVGSSDEGRGGEEGGHGGGSRGGREH